MIQVNPGWYPDPSGDPSKLRYWNGSGWSDELIDAAPVQAPEQVYGSPYTPQTQQFAPQTQQLASPAAKNPGKAYGVASLTLGIICILLVVTSGSSVARISDVPDLIFYALGAIFGVAALTFGIVGRRGSRAVGMSHDLATAGIVTSIIAISFRLLVAIGVAIYYFVPGLF